MLYTLIYDFLLQHLFNGALSNYSMEIMNVNTNMNVWLAHTFTIVVMVLIFVVLVLFTKWLFKLCSGLFLLK